MDKPPGPYAVARQMQAVRGDILAKRKDTGETYIVPQGKYLVCTSDGRWRATNAMPPIWLELTPKQEALTEFTGEWTDDERDWYDVN